MNNLTPESIPILWNSTEVPASLLMKQWKIMPVRGNFNHLIAWLLTLLTQTLMLHPVSQFFWFGRWRQSNLLKFSTLQKFGSMNPFRSGAWLGWLHLARGWISPKHKFSFQVLCFYEIPSYFSYCFIITLYISFLIKLCFRIMCHCLS